MLTLQYILEWIRGYVIDVGFTSDYFGIKLKVSWFGCLLLFNLWYFIRRIGRGKAEKNQRRIVRIQQLQHVIVDSAL